MQQETGIGRGKAYYEAQCSVVGSALIDARSIPEIMQAVRVEDFGQPGLRTVFSAIHDLWLEGQPVDPVTVLGRTGDAYRQLARECMEITPTAANVGAYCRIVRDNARLMRLRLVAEKILQASELAEALALMAECETIGGGVDDLKVVTIQEALQASYVRATEPLDGAWIDWGFFDLNSILRVGRGKFVVLAADSSVGKTALALQLAWNIARRQRVGFYSLETDTDTLGDRAVAQRVGIDLAKLQRRTVTKDQWRQWLEVNKLSAKVDLELVPASRLSLAQLRAHILARRHQIAVIDYIQMLDAPGRDAAEKIRAVSLSLHRLAQESGVTIIGLSQLTVPPDAPNKWVPRLESLRESRQLKNDADVVLMLYLHERNRRAGGRWLSVSKNKEGGLGKIYLAYDGPHMFFRAAHPPAEKEPAPTPAPDPGFQEVAEDTPFDPRQGGDGP